MSEAEIEEMKKNRTKWRQKWRNKMLVKKRALASTPMRPPIPPIERRKFKLQLMLDMPIHPETDAESATSEQRAEASPEYRESAAMVFDWIPEPSEASPTPSPLPTVLTIPPQKPPPSSVRVPSASAPLLNATQARNKRMESGERERERQERLRKKKELQRREQRKLNRIPPPRAFQVRTSTLDQRRSVPTAREVAVKKHSEAKVTKELCKKCFKPFLPGSIAGHMTTHDIAPRNCEYCGDTLKSEKTLKKHLQRCAAKRAKKGKMKRSDGESNV